MLKTIFIFIFSIKYTHQSMRPGNEPMLFVGLFQNCISTDHRPHTSDTNAGICKVAMEKAYQNKQQYWSHVLHISKFDLKGTINPDDMTFQSYTFCTHSEAVQLGVQLKLNQSFFVSNKMQETPRWNKQRLKDWQQISKIIHILVYASEEVSHFLEQFLFNEDYVVSFLNMDFDVTSSLDGHNLASYSNVLQINAEELLHKLVNSNVNNFGIIHLKDEASTTIYNVAFEQFYNKVLLRKYHELKLCHTLYEIDSSNGTGLQDLVAEISQNIQLKIFIVIGDPQSQNKLFRLYAENYTQQTQRTWISYDFDHKTKWFYFKYWNLYSYYLPSLRYVGWSSPLPEMNLNLTQTFLAKYCYDSYQTEVSRIISIIEFRIDMGFLSFFSFKNFKFANVEKFKYFTNGLRKLADIVNELKNKRREFILRSYDLSQNKLGYPGPAKCLLSFCPQGSEPYFGKINQSQPWIIKYGYSCQKCPHNYFNDKIASNQSCRRCPEMTVSSDDRTHCYSPYHKEFINFHQLLPRLTISMSGVGFLLSLFNIAVLLIYRKSLFAKAINVYNCLLHLVLTNLQFISIPFLFIGEPSLLKCQLRPVSVFLLSTCPAIIILVKSQNILAAFRAKTVVTDSDKKKSKIIQSSMVIAVLVIDTSILLWSLLVRLPEITKTINHTIYEISLDCNTGFHINAQILLIIIQHLFSAVQAYRGRNLPGPFNEAMSIAYSTLTVIFTYITVFPLYFLQRDLNITRNIQMLILAIAQTLFLFIFYGPKIHLLLCQKHKNTKAYFRDQMWKRSQAKVNLQISRSSTHSTH